MTGACMALVFLLSSAPLHGDGLPDPIQAPDLDTASLSSYVRSFVGPRRLPGVAVSIVGRDGPLYQAGFGQMGESGESVTEAVRFQAGPFVEAITGFAILQLADSGRIDLDEPVHHYLPG
ncbi:MAG: serine hydrolase domain-containing protein, partial [Gemmatimonadota bacterium]|nr:serine hydrolase domain-containing protein [Gemmatimonadota bacterium]